MRRAGQQRKSLARCSAETAITASWDRAAVQQRIKGSHAGLSDVAASAQLNRGSVNPEPTLVLRSGYVELRRLRIH
jgi:hypothetical protein